MNLFKTISFLFKVSYDNVTIKRRGFFLKSEESKEHLELIGTNFLNGYHEALDVNSLDTLCDYLQGTDLEYKGFAYEGAAMGLVISDFFKIKKRTNHFIENMAPHHIYMLLVGIGWGYAKLPVSIEKEITKYDPLLRWLVIDGYGFYSAYFDAKKYIHQKTEPKLSPYGKHVFYQGVGRSLWFIEGTDISRIAITINTFPEKYHGDLWSGVGLAATYAGKVNKEEILHLKKAAHSYLPNLQQGAAFAAKARIRAGNMTLYTKRTTEILTGLNVEKASNITDVALSKINKNLNSALQYKNWRSLIVQEFSSLKKIAL